MLDQNTVDRIIEAAQIQDVVSDFVTLRRRGVNLIGLCPFHNEKTPSFSVSPAKGIFKCFGCGKGGNAVHFVMEHEQISYYEALKQLARKYHIEFQERVLTPEEEAARNDRESMFMVNEFAQNYFVDTLHQHPEGKSVGLSYFLDRGFREDIIRKFQLGYCLNQRDGFSQAALKGGFNKKFLLKTGLSLESESGSMNDRFRERVMFPVHTLSGKVVAFGGRTLRKDEKIAKYVNSPESEIYHKGNELYGMYFAKNAIVKQDRCFIVEGYTDVISLHQNGIENVVASSGTALTQAQIRLIHRFTEHVTILFDGDAAGIKASLRGIDLLLEEGLNIQVLLLPNGEDPDSFARKHNSAFFIDYVKANATDFLRFKTNLLLHEAGNNPVMRASLVLDIVRSIAVIPSQVVRAEYVKECSSLLKVEEALLYHEINKLKSAEKQKGISQSTAVAPPEKVEVANQSKGNEPEYRFQKEERCILQTLLRFGHQDMRTKAEKQQNAPFMSIAQFIIDDIQNDGLEFQDPIHQAILKEYQQQLKDEHFNAEKHFLYHANIQIAQLATDLLTEKYTLSKIHTKLKHQPPDEDKLSELVNRVMYEFKNAVLLDIIKDKLQCMKVASEEKNTERLEQLMEELKELDIIKRELAKELGERILTKF